MSSRFEDLVEALINGETPTLEPLSHLELYLIHCINGSGTEGLPEPDSRLEFLLYQLVEKLSGGGGIITEPIAFIDQTTGTVYDLHTSGGDLEMAELSGDSGVAGVILVDRKTGISYKLYVSDGKLRMQGTEG